VADETDVVAFVISSHGWQVFAGWCKIVSFPGRKRFSIEKTGWQNSFCPQICKAIC